MLCCLWGITTHALKWSSMCAHSHIEIGIFLHSWGATCISPHLLSLFLSLSLYPEPHFTRTQSAVTDSSSQQADVILSKGKPSCHPHKPGISTRFVPLKGIVENYVTIFSPSCRSKCLRRLFKTYDLQNTYYDLFMKPESFLSLH